MTPTKARARVGTEVLRAALTDAGLREEETPIDGYAFTHWKQPAAAVSFWMDNHNGARPTRFYVSSHSFILSD